ncbi:MAG: hypothetical protein HYY16_17075 [Planctomycetes bacterium]|nr:hypothetical protein [Planctomycetota bacterium]
MNGFLTVLMLLQPPQDDTKAELEALKKKVDELEKKLTPQETPQDLAGRAQEGVKRDAGEVYSKPFLARFGRNVYLGGYVDLEYFNVEDSNSDTFDQHRLVPFIYADVSKYVKVATEIEIEHGGELGVEFAHVDGWLSDALNVRAGIILDPLGKFNLTHDAPFQDLTFRPLVSENIIGTVLREPGAGFFGQIDADPWEFEYELYVVNGYKGLRKTGGAGATVINRTSGLRNARPHRSVFGEGGYRDFNDNKAVVGRFSASPFLGLEVGVSTHAGKYDERGDNQLTITALDLTMRLGGVARELGVESEFLGSFEIVAEWARADIERDDFAKAQGVPDNFDGWYGEVRYHFMPEFLREAIPGASDESTFTLVYRYDSLDLDNADRTQHTIGLNFRPREDTVVKIEYQFREEGGVLDETPNDAFAASVATYF